MTYDFEGLLSSLDIDYKLRRDDVVTVECPFCTGSGKNAHTKSGAFLYGKCYKCFRCGSHSVLDTIMTITCLPVSEAKCAISKYASESVDVPYHEVKEEAKCKLPKAGSGNIEHIFNYLMVRGLNPLETIVKYNLFPTSLYPDTSNAEILKSFGILKDRVVIPVYDKNSKVRSWTARRMDNSKYARYISCPADCESLPIKTMLYNEQYATTKSIVVLEGAFDAIKFGDGAVATMGTEVSIEQIRKLQQYDKVIIVFDPEPKAQERAKYLGKSVGVLTPCSIFDISKFTEKKDFGDMDLGEVNFFRKILGFDLRSDNIVL